MEAERLNLLSLNVIAGAAQRTEGNQRSLDPAALMLPLCPWTQGAKDHVGIGPVSVSCYSKDGLGLEEFHLLNCMGRGGVSVFCFVFFNRLRLFPCL